MTNTYSRHVRKLDLRSRVKSVLERLSSCSPGPHSHEPVNCFRNHRIVTSRKNGEAMSIGCFGECSFGSDSSESNDRANHGPKVYCKFYPPIQTLLREKDPEKWYTDMVNDLATVGDDPNQFNEFGEAPLCVAAYKGQGMVVAELLQRDSILVNIKGKHGRTPLYIAAEGGHVFIVKCLLSHTSIDVNSRNAPGGATPLMIASRRGHSRVVELLLQHPDCDAELVDRDGQSAIRHARTDSVKLRIHSLKVKARSVDNVMAPPYWRGSKFLEETSLCVSPQPEPSDHHSYLHHSLQDLHTDIPRPRPRTLTDTEEKEESDTGSVIPSDFGDEESLLIVT